jgi:spore maturation protein CgeB
MRIALIGNKGYDTIEYHTVDALEKLGHTVFHFDMSDFFNFKYLYNYWFAKFVPRYVEIMFGNLASKVIDIEPDLVICTYRFVPASAVQRIKTKLTSVPIIQLNPDALTTFEKQQIFYSPYDYYFTKDPYIVNFMRNKADLNAHYLPEAFNDRVHKMPDDNRIDLEKKIDIDVVAFGSIYPYRSRMIMKLMKAGIKVSIFGNNQSPNPEIQKSFRNEWITGERKSEILVGSKIVFNNFHFAEIDSVNCKFFEIAGSGGFQICDYKPSIDEYSKIDPSSFTFRSVDEAVEKVIYYLDKPSLRHELAAVQREHFLLNHTYDIRMKQMLDIVFSH